MKDNLDVNIDGHVKIWNPESGEIFVDQHNAINAETMSMLIASALSSPTSSYIYEMHFGNGGVVVDETGLITYKDVATNLESGTLAGLFNPTYYKIIDKTETYINNPDPTLNKIDDPIHSPGLNYTDLKITCTLNKEEPTSDGIFNLTNFTQEQMDTASSYNGQFIFNELGLKSKGLNGGNTGNLLSHIVFHPVQKSANRVIQVIYTLRIRIA